MSAREPRLWIGLLKLPVRLLAVQHATSTRLSSSYFSRVTVATFLLPHRLSPPSPPPPTPPPALFLATVAVWWWWTTSRRRSCSTWEQLSCTAPLTPTRGSRARQESHGSPPEVKKRKFWSPLPSCSFTPPCCRSCDCTAPLQWLLVQQLHTFWSHDDCTNANADTPLYTCKLSQTSVPAATEHLVLPTGERWAGTSQSWVTASSNQTSSCVSPPTVCSAFCLREQ